MCERRSGSVLVVDEEQRLSGIFTGRDAVRLLAKDKDAGSARLVNVMTKNPVVIAPKSRAIDALRTMVESGCRHVPVTEGGTIKGVVSRGDFKGMELEEYRWRKSGPLTAAATGVRTLADILKGRKAQVVSENATVQHTCRGMRRLNCGCSLVVDNDQRLSGIFTGRDAVRILARAEHAAATRVKEAMTRTPVTLTPVCLAIDALRAMDEGGFRHIPVVAAERVVGVVSRSDFTGIEVDRLDEEEHLKEVIW
jgi:CBS domain-containing protein